MNIFLSWSGDRSRAIAKALRSWLPDVIQSLKPWMSEEDIAKGATWNVEMTEKLKTCPIGIICLTPDNLTAPWVLFEAGAISNNVEVKQLESGQVVIVGKTQVCPYLYGLTPNQIKEPLSKFQATVANKEQTKELLQTINKTLGDNKLSDRKLDDAFEKWWPELEKSLSAVPKSEAPAPQLSEKQMLEQILTAVRNLERVEREGTGNKFLVSPTSLAMRRRLLELGLVGSLSPFSPAFADLLNNHPDWVSVKTALETAKKPLGSLSDYDKATLKRVFGEVLENLSGPELQRLEEALKQNRKDTSASSRPTETNLDTLSPTKKE